MNTDTQPAIRTVLTKPTTDYLLSEVAAKQVELLLEDFL